MLVEQFWDYVDKSGGPSACWNWTRAKNRSGYGSVWVNKKAYTASRFAYELVNGKIPPHNSYHGFVVRHTCDNRACCNPAHLVIGTQGENNRDRDMRRRVKSRPRGEKNHHSILTKQDVFRIRKMKRDGMKPRAISNALGFSVSCVAHVYYGRCWNWLADTPLGQAALEREGLAA